MNSTASLLTALLLTAFAGPSLVAAPPNHPSTAPSGQPGTTSCSQYKMITGFKQPFNDDLQLHLSKGWVPVGGVSVTTWNNDLFFAQLLGKASAE